MQQFRLSLILTAALVLTACANGYKQFYMPDSQHGYVLSRRVAPPPENPIVDRAGAENSRALLDMYYRKGYAIIGQSAFNSTQEVNNSQAIAQAKEVGADVVIIFDPKYLGAETSSVPISMPTTQTSYHTGTATAYGSAGPVTAYGSGTTTTYGTSTSYIPVTVHKNQYAAVFLVKRRYSFGAFFRDLNDGERKEIQSNKGISISLVVENSPAFNADVLPGDLVVSFNDSPVTNREIFSQLLEEFAKSTVKVSIVRQGKRIDKTLELH